QHSRCADRGQRGVEANGRSLCALSHRRLSSSPFRTRHPDGDTVIECVTVNTLQREFSDPGPAMIGGGGDKAHPSHFFWSRRRDEVLAAAAAAGFTVSAQEWEKLPRDN